MVHAPDVTCSRRSPFMQLLSLPRTILIATLLALILSSCASGPAASTVTLGAEGGSVVSDDAALTLEVPPGALTAATEITLERLSRDRWPAELEGLPVVGDVYEMGPHGLAFAEPVTITRRFDAAADGLNPEAGLPVIFLANGAPDGSWTTLQEMTVRADGDEIVVTSSMAHFSTQAAFAGGVTAALEPTRVTERVEGTFTATARFRSTREKDVRVFLSAHVGDVADRPARAVVSRSPILDLTPSTINRQRFEDIAPGGEQTFAAEFICTAVGEEVYGVGASFTDPPPEEQIPFEEQVLMPHRQAIEYHVALGQGTADCQAEPEASDVTSLIEALPMVIIVGNELIRVETDATAGEPVSMPVLTSLEGLWTAEYPEPAPGHVIVFRLDGVDFEANMMTEAGGDLYIMAAHPPLCHYAHVHGALPDTPIRSLLPGPDGEYITRTEHLDECGFGPPNFFMIPDPRDD